MLLLIPNVSVPFIFDFKFPFIFELQCSFRFRFLNVLLISVFFSCYFRIALFFLVSNFNVPYNFELFLLFLILKFNMFLLSTLSFTLSSSDYFYFSKFGLPLNSMLRYPLNYSFLFLFRF